MGDEGCMRDTLELNGVMRHRFQVLEKLDPKLKCVYIPIKAMCSLDLQKMAFRFE